MFGRVLALALTLTATVRGDNCAKRHAAMQLKTTNLSSQYCSSSDTTTCSMDKCDCSSCCEFKENTCAKLSLTKQCGSDKEGDASKAADTATDSDFDSKCCMTKANATATCSSKMSKAITDSKGCAAGKVIPNAKMSTTVADDLSDYATKCCEAEVKCDTVTCPAGYKDKTSKATIKCTSKPCSDSSCCDPDPAKCAGVYDGTGNKTCSGNTYADPSKYGNDAKSDGSDFKAQCCTDLATCEAFKAATVTSGGGGGSSTTSAATQQHAGATLSLLFAVAGGLVMA